MTKTVLVTGGAGYIGSHVVRQLGDAGAHVIVLDNLCTGFADAVLSGELIRGDCGDSELLDQIFGRFDIESVLHFAAHTIVPESVADPLKYYANNTCKTRNLLQVCAKHSVNNFVFSSTAAVYGIPDSDVAISEAAPTSPINPYGLSKLMSEWMLRDLAATTGLRHVTLRYFNVAGSDPQGRIGQSTAKATLLTKVACEAAIGLRDRVAIFGTDYPTPDGTGVRDYIHVEDLADAHLLALAYLRDNGPSITLNCGYGHGYSVRAVLEAVEKAAGKPLNIVEEARRAGDPPSLVADAQKLRSLFAWEPRYDDLDAIVSTSLAWEQKLADRR
ncbi:MAG: UDP-glucose 4-epimerase GalE [Gammaproteobacteria bacterium]|nr:UDP-glucose 4-epimerase GalE [Gammaproteobacteria bacterium]MDH3768818.1 UDP-glucose 4-epimerase GalE [Gammaproteobacteria bacterium]